MQIDKHRLVGVPFISSPDHGGHFAPAPRFVVIHYTAGRTMDGAVQTLTAKDENYVSAHVCIARDGALKQLVAFDTIAYHAGESIWKGVRRLNTCSIGIELVNPGFVDVNQTPIGGWPVYYATHKHGGPKRAWYTYTAPQIAACVELCRALKALYPIEEFVGHDDIAPTRKLDPGPAFPWDSFLKGIAA